MTIDPRTMSHIIEPLEGSAMISITNAYRGLKEFEQSWGTAFPQS